MKDLYDLFFLFIIGLAVVAFLCWRGPRAIGKRKRGNYTVTWKKGNIPPPKHIADPIPRGYARVTDENGTRHVKLPKRKNKDPQKDWRHMGFF